VSHPIPTKRPHGRAARQALKVAEAAEWHGPTRRYDILKEGTIAFVVVLLLVLGMAAILSSPDKPSVTVQSWARVAPADFMATAASELAGTSETATYGQPYNHGASNVQTIGVSWQMLVGVRQPINTAETFVLSPLSKISGIDPAISSALNEYNSATHIQQQKWVQSYMGLLDTSIAVWDNIPGGPYIWGNNPVPKLIATELSLAQSGAIDADLLAQQSFYGSNYTKPLLFIEDGNYFSSLAQQDHLKGAQWGVMNETGSYPGQPWLWLYTLWYQLPGFSSSANVDLIAIYMTGLATVILLAVPFIPGVRDIPKIIPLHRLIWRQWSRDQKQKAKE
jgi:hypothetical protein